ncbi:MAG: TetR/AcrR family transcriptional regulator [Propionibacteriales bacterium]|nr:TetR/AcrR family transcriptional regulator [Propionibacteriales bacterium]
MTEDELELPRVVVVAWGMAAHPQRGPKRELSHERIVEAAIAIADRDGLPAVTMARVAESLGFTTMALYRYVTNKDELLALMQDAATSDIEPPVIDPHDWRRALRAWTEHLQRGYEAHPWMLAIPATVESVAMPGNMAIVDRALRAMRTLDLTAQNRIAVILMLSTLAGMVAGLNRDLAKSPAAVSGLGAGLRDIVTADRFPDLSPLIDSGDYLGPDPSDEPVTAEFDFGIERLLDGLARFESPNQNPDRPVVAEPAPELDPAIAATLAQEAYDVAVAARKQGERRVKELHKRETAAAKERDRARDRATRVG